MSAHVNSSSHLAGPGMIHHLTVPVCDRCGAVLGADLLRYDEIVVCDDDESCWITVQFQTVLAPDGRHSTGLTTETLPPQITWRARQRR